jgi:uncharacterized membrane protein (UPF0127 family)
MRMLCAVNVSRNAVLARHVQMASSLRTRFIGLLGRASLGEDEGLYLKPCRSIHTFFMRFTIDVLFLDARGVVSAKTTLPPWRLSRWEPRAAAVLELPAGTLARTRTEIGDQISMKEA